MQSVQQHQYLYLYLYLCSTPTLFESVLWYKLEVGMVCT